MLKEGWKTAAIVPELESEIRIMNTEEYRRSVGWLQTLAALIETQYDDCLKSDEARAVMDSWLQERDSLRSQTKNMFNPQFGSIFRTYHNPTYFSRRMMRLANVYTSNVSNFLEYSLNHAFYPRRAALPHEPTFLVPADFTVARV